MSESLADFRPTERDFVSGFLCEFYKCFRRAFYRTMSTAAFGRFILKPMNKQLLDLSKYFCGAFYILKD